MYLAINSLRPVKERQKKWGLILQDGNWITLSTDRQTAGVSRVTFNTMTHKLADRLKKKISFNIWRLLAISQTGQKVALFSSLDLMSKEK